MNKEIFWGELFMAIISNIDLDQTSGKSHTEDRAIVEEFIQRVVKKLDLFFFKFQLSRSFLSKKG